MKKIECEIIISCVQHRLKYIKRTLNLSLTSEKRQMLNDEMFSLRQLETKLLDFQTKFR